MKNITKLTGCMAIFLLGMGCGFDPYKKSIEGSALTPLSEAEKKELNKYGDRPITELEPADKKAVADILSKQIDVRKIEKQFCHFAALGFSKDECLSIREKCLKELEKLDTKALHEEYKTKITDLPIPPQLTHKAFEKLANFLGSAEVVNAECGDDVTKIKAQIKQLPKELGLTEAQIAALNGNGTQSGKNNPNIPEELPTAAEVLAQIKDGMDGQVDSFIAKLKAETSAAELQAFKALSGKDIKNIPEFKEMLQSFNKPFAELAKQGVIIDMAKAEQLVLDFFRKVQAGL